MEIMTAVEVAYWLKVSKRHIYELTLKRYRSGDVREHPLPCIRVGGSVRFIKADVEEWIKAQRA